jgi:hypothetical protein
VKGSLAVCSGPFAQGTAAHAKDRFGLFALCKDLAYSIVELDT